MPDDTFVDGCGMKKDEPLGEGVRIRYKTNGRAQDDLTVYVQDGHLYVYGMNCPIVIEPVSFNHVRIRAGRFNPRAR